MFKEHCRDEDLVSALCGELRGLSRFRVGWHLRVCRSCGRRLHNLRDELLAPPVEWRDIDPVNPIVTERARLNFLAWTQICEVRFEVAKTWRRRARTLVRVPLTAGVCALVLIGGIDVWQQFHPEIREAIPEPVQQASRRAFVPPPVPTHPRVNPGLLPAPPETTDFAVPVGTLPAMPTGPQPEEVEVAIWSILHHAGACLGEPIELLPSSEPGSLITVHGTVQTRARRDQVTRLLLSSRYGEWMRIKLVTTEGLITRAKRLPLHEAHAATAVTVERNVEFERALSGALKAMHPDEAADQTRRRWMDLSHRAIREVEEASSEAWAVQRLRRRFGQALIEKLPAESREMVAAMVRDHLSELRQHLEELNQQLEPVLSRFVGEPSALPGAPDMFEGVERLRMALESGMAGSARYPGSPAELAGEILTLAGRLDADLANAGEWARHTFPANLAALFRSDR